MLAEAGRFVELNVGAGVRLGKVELEIKGVETQALLEARLHNVTAILARVLTTLDRNPELLKSVGEALGDVGGGAHDLLTDTGDVVKSAGQGAESALGDVGRGAGRASPDRPGRRAGRRGPGAGRPAGRRRARPGRQEGIQGVGQGAQQGVQGPAEEQEQGGHSRPPVARQASRPRAGRPPPPHQGL